VRADPTPIFVSFEGIDGAGKSTQVRRLKAFLEQRGRNVFVAREPGGTELGERIRDLLLNGGEIAPWAEAHLFAAARAQLVERVLRPALSRGCDVIVDRYIDSSLAYQGIARGLGVLDVYDLNRAAVQELFPDRTFLLSLPAEDASFRHGTQLRLFPLDGEGGPPDRMERESLVFRRNVEDAYRELVEQFPDRIVEIDASSSKGKIAAFVRENVRQLLESAAARAACS
jgi:dTMP kinase